MPFGKLLLTVRTGASALPVNDCEITVVGEGGEAAHGILTKKDSGLSETFSLYAPERDISLEEHAERLPYSLFEAFLRAEGCYRTRIRGIQIFEGVISDLPVELIPLPETAKTPEDVGIIEIDIPAHTLTRGGEGTPDAPTARAAEYLPAVNIISGVFIPENITVHLGTPDSAARNVRVPFVDYIKNVASSEVYPTWPKEALKANVTAQISLTLNRIYTEWYRSRGYDFDITSSTAYDQAFVYGRNIFEEINEVVDGYFNRYIRRPNRVEPLFAVYCSGTTASCNGLSQWGSVTLAQNGQNSEGILRYYYGDIEISETDDIREPTGSYPGVPLTFGSSGSDVLIIQEQLNRVAINYPAIPLNRTTGVYDTLTESAVKAFQHIFVLPETGVVDMATWYRLSYVYTSVKRLAQITSEGQRAEYNKQVYPGSPLSTGARGSEVQEIQFYLRRISIFNPTVISPKLDGIFGEGTRSAVISFQKAYGLAQTGIVNESVWKRIVEVYNGTNDNIDEPDYGGDARPYPGYTVRRGAVGDDVLYIQSRINAINSVFPIVKITEEDGIFGRLTAEQVNSFAIIFGIRAGGEVNERVWNKINEIYAAVESRCIFESDAGEGTKPYPNAAIIRGSRGENLRYIQEKINVIYRSLPYVGELIVDGVFGPRVEASVRALQRIFGLSETGRVDAATWRLMNYVYTAVKNGCI